MGKLKTIIIILVTLLLCTFMAHAGQVHDAALKGELSTLKVLLKENPELLDAQGKNKKTLLHWAVQGGHIAVVEFLLKEGAQVNTRNQALQTSLHYAASMGHKDIVSLLLKEGAEIDARTERGITALGYSIYGNHADIMHILVAEGANVLTKGEDGRTLLHDAAWSCSREVLALLNKKGVAIDAKTKTNRTPFYNAVLGGNLDGVKFFIEKGADINAVYDGGLPPLAQAVKNGKKEITFHMLKAGAKVENSYLHLAAVRGYGKIVHMLLQKGAEPNAKDKTGKTPLYYASRYNHKKTAGLLVAGGADKGEIKKSFGPSGLLQKELGEGNALVWYLGHSGWAVKTGKHLLIFDYFKRNALPDTPFIANGTINPEEIKDLDVTVFVSHDHQDHYMPSVFEWAKKVKKIDYVFGFEPKDKKGEYVLLNSGQRKKFNGMKVIALKSNDTGVAFFVNVDGVNVFHSGDHANRKQDFSGPFKKEIDFLATAGLKPDIFFAPVSGCGFGDLEAVKKGVYYTIKKLNPRSVFPMHAGGGEERLFEFAKKAIKVGFKTPMCVAQFSGDYFFVGKKGIKGALSLDGVKTKKKKGDTSSCKAKTCKGKG